MKLPNLKQSLFAKVLTLFFLLLCNSYVVAQSVSSCPDNNHPHMIDLGLPSGTLWACCNVGANKPEGLGGHYAWGEIEEKHVYTWATYTHCDGSARNIHNIGRDISGTKYDVAAVKWGNGWRMPTMIQFDELVGYTTNEWVTVNGVRGKKFKSKNGKTIFFPAAGDCWGSDLLDVGSYAVYWSSWRDVTTTVVFQSTLGIAHDFMFGSGAVGNLPLNLFLGYSVRPVRK